MPLHDFKQAVRHAWEAAWGQGDVAALDAIMHPDYALENAGSGSTTGLDDLKREVVAMRAAFPDLRASIDQLIVEGDDFALFWSSTGTFAGSLNDVPATGHQLQTHGSIQGTLRDGLITRERVTWDERTLLADLGIPSLRSAFDVAPTGGGLASPPHLLDDDVLKGFNRQFVTGVTVVTAVDSDGSPRGLVVNAYTSVSLDPPLVLVCVQKTSSTYATLFRAGHMGINIMSNRQAGTVSAFASKTPDKFAEIAWHEGPCGSPLVDGSAASIEVEIKERFQARTHAVFIGRVLHAEVSDAIPMVYRAGHFFDAASLQGL